MNETGALAFGVVIGWVTYRTLRRSTPTGLSDIATVIGAVGGAAVTGLFPAADSSFGAYGIGLGIGFLFYLITALLINGLAAKGSRAAVANEWLGSEVGGSTGGNRDALPIFKS
jgi:hypothetical protein